MSVQLPTPIGAYLEANGRFDVDAMVAPFAEYAIVRDEHDTHQGHDAIRAWIEKATVGSKAVAVAQAVTADGTDHVVTALVSGEFPGSPVTLTFRFTLADDQIASLEIE